MDLYFKDQINYFWIIWYFLLTFVIRKAINGFGDLFDREKLGDKTNKLFLNNQFFEEFLSNLKNQITVRKQIRFSLIWVLIVQIPYVVGQFIGEQMLYNINILNYSKYLWLGIYNHLLFSYLIFFLASAGYILIVSMIAIHNIGRDPDRLSISKLLKTENYIDYLNEIDHDDENNLSFLSFSSKLRIIGHFLFEITLRVIILLIIWSIMVSFWEFNPLVGLFNALLTFIVITLSFIPQVLIHQVLKNAKSITVRSLEEMQENLTNEILKNISKDSSKLKQDTGPQSDALRLIKELIVDVRTHTTWTYDFPAVLKLVFTAIISVAVFVINTIISLSVEDYF